VAGLQRSPPLRDAIIAFLLALSGQAPPETPAGPPASPAALVREQSRERLTSLTLLGAWQGRVSGATMAAPIEVTFTDGLRPSTVFAYFIFGVGEEASRLRRLGSLAADQIVFVLADGGKITLRLDATGQRLVGSVVQHTADRESVSSVELVRLRDAFLAPSASGPPTQSHPVAR